LDWENKCILITGGTGSFGKKFIQIMVKEFHPKKIIVFSRDELKQHEMRLNGFDDPALRYFIGDVRDASRLGRAMREVDIVVHAAALKQVPACEYNPIEAVLTNVMGARNVIEAALDADVEKVIALSTDKAVNPVNLYGATKLVAEKLFVQANSYSGTKPTRFACVRYGNVVGSRGSVIPLFMDQRKSCKITITDPRMTRFWITLDQGVHFVARCIEQIHGGEVFVPKIPSMNITDLAKAVAPECEISLIGIRPGEKLHEVLIGEDESWHSVEMDDMFVIKPLHSWWNSENWPEGKKLPEGFRYSSDANPCKLSINELQKMIC
jgi:UDP-N-acetylglucosamine 4,6-dehydratase/5-epimerase